MNEGHRLVTIVELPGFEKAANQLLSEDELAGLITYLATEPDAGDLIPGTGGVRKVRWAARGKGKSGGARAIYLYCDQDMPLYLITVFSKGERSDLSKADKNAMRSVVDMIIEQHRADRIVGKVVRLGRPRL